MKKEDKRKRQKDIEFLVGVIKNNGRCPLHTQSTLSSDREPCISCIIASPGCLLPAAKQNAIHKLYEMGGQEHILLELMI